MVKKSELLDLIMENMNTIDELQASILKLEKRVKKLEPKKERKSKNETKK